MFARGLHGKYAEQKDSIRWLQFNRHVGEGLLADDKDMSEKESFLQHKTTEASYKLHQLFWKAMFSLACEIRIVRYTS